MENFKGYFKHPRFRGIALYVAGHPKVGRVLVVMVGDDRKHEVDSADLQPIDEDEFCDGCGAMGCGHGTQKEA